MTILRRCSQLLGASICVALAARGADAQTLRGIVYDSLLTRGPMEGARVALDGLPQSALTDRRGRFVLDDIPEGSYLLTFYHPSLDSAGLSAPAYRVIVPPGGLRDLLLFTPSFSTTSQFLCGSTLDTNSTIVLGRVRAAEDGRPLAGATATVSWWEMSFGGAEGVKNSNRTMTVDSDSLGEFRLCGVPTDVDLSMTVRLGSHQSGQIAFPDRGADITISDIAISLSDSAATAAADSAYAADPAAVRPGRARLRVRIRDEADRPIENAIVGIRGHAASGTSNADGDARLNAVPAGSQSIVVRAIGRAPLTRVVALTPDRETSLAVRLSEAGVVLPEYRIAGIREDPTRAGFERRKRSGSGTFLDSDQLNRIGRTAASLSSIGGVRVPMTQVGIGYTAHPMLQFRSSAAQLCTPTVFVDGAPRIRMDGWEFHHLLQYAIRVEIYSRSVSIPSEFALGGLDCGVVVVWTQR